MYRASERAPRFSRHALNSLSCVGNGGTNNVRRVRSRRGSGENMQYLRSHSMRTATLALPLLVFSAPSSAQLGGLFDAVKEKVEQEVERQVQGVQGDQRQTSSVQDEGSSRLRVNEGFNFTPGRTILVQDDFSDT